MSLSRRAFDVVVIGSGLAGAEVAANLLARGLSVVVLEAGKIGSLQHIGLLPSTAPLEDPLADPDYVVSCSSSEGSHSPLGYRRRAGGRGLYWRGIAIAIEDVALAEWPQSVRAMLHGPAETPGSYAEAANAIAVWETDFQKFKPDSRGHSTLLARLAGLNGLTASKTPRAVRYGPTGWEAYSSIKSVPKSSIIADFPVGSVEVQGQSFMAIRSDRNAIVRGRTIVFAASAIPNCFLIRGLISSPKSFKLTDHVAAGSVAFVPGRQDRTDEQSCFLGYDAATQSNLFCEQIPDSGGYIIDSWAMAEPGSLNPISLSFDNGSASSSVSPECASQLTQRRVDLSERVASLDGAFNFDFDRTRGPLGDDFNRAVKRARAAPGTAFSYQEQMGALDHESGGLALGGPLVDERGQVRAAPGAYVAGTALFPRAGAANPSLTNLALARGLSAHIAGDM